MRRLLNRRSSVWETATAGAECWRAGIVLPISGKCTAVLDGPASQYDRAVADASSKNRAGGAALLRKKADFKSIRTGHTSIFSGTCDDVSGI